MFKKFLFVLLIIPNICFALNPKLENYVRIIKESGEQVKNIGDVLEILVRYHFRLHSSDTILGNLYYLCDDRIAGELDLVYIANPTDIFPSKFVLIVGEMKLWKNNKKALDRAKIQLERFITNLKSNRINKYVYRNDKSFKMFNGQISPYVRTMTIGPAGSKSDGFDMEFDLTLEEGELIFNEFRQNK